MTTAVHRFRMAMARHCLGRVITPEAAAAIESEVFAEPDLSIDPGRFAPLAHGDYTIRVESFRAILGELEPLHRAHWLETEAHRHGLELKPDYEAVIARERAGRAVQFTVRHGNALAGHLLMYLGQSLHTGTLVAEEDALFLLPEHRGGFTAMALLRYAEQTLQALGVREIRANSKVINHADVLMRRMRYQQVAIQFVKIIKEPHHAET